MKENERKELEKKYLCRRMQGTGVRKKAVNCIEPVVKCSVLGEILDGVLNEIKGGVLGVEDKGL